ncbi:MAG: hypothetical protein AAF458_20230 [Pseudomonadota bacterium]
MEVIGEHYQVRCNDDRTVVTCEGNFRLHGPATEYRPVVDLLLAVADAQSPAITLDLTQARFLNSEGINTLFKFAIRIRKHGVSKLQVRASQDIPWQSKSLRNLKRILPGLELDIT